MRVIHTVLKKVSQFLYSIAGVLLVVLMLITTADVAMRIVYQPIEGIYDITLILAGLIISLAIPYSLLKGVHVCMTFLVDAVSLSIRKLLRVLTRCMAILFFALVGWNLMVYGIRLYQTGELTHTLHWPLYPIVFSMGIACLFSDIVIAYQIFGDITGEEQA